MYRFVLSVLILAALLAAGCGSEQKEPAPQSQTETVAQNPAAQPTAQKAPDIETLKPVPAPATPRDQKFPTDLKMNPSGVRYEEMVVGTGKEVVKGSLVEFDYNFWLADPTGLLKNQAITTSVGRPGQAYKCEVGVHPLPGLSDGLIGMKIGGSRRIYVPRELGFPAGHPMAGNNLIYEAIQIKEMTPEEVTRFQDSLANRLELIRHIQDSVHKAVNDSLAREGLDSLGRPLNAPEDTALEDKKF